MMLFMLTDLFTWRVNGWNAHFFFLTSFYSLLSNAVIQYITTNQYWSQYFELRKFYSQTENWKLTEFFLLHSKTLEYFDMFLLWPLYILTDTQGLSILTCHNTLEVFWVWIMFLYMWFHHDHVDCCHNHCHCPLGDDDRLPML